MTPPDSVEAPPPLPRLTRRGGTAFPFRLAISFGLLAVLLAGSRMPRQVACPDDDYLATIMTIGRFVAAGDLYDHWHGVSYLTHNFRPLIIVPALLGKVILSPLVPLVFDAGLCGFAVGSGVYWFVLLLRSSWLAAVPSALLVLVAGREIIGTAALALPVVLALYCRRWRWLAAATLLLLMDGSYAGLPLAAVGLVALGVRDYRRPGVLLLALGLLMLKVMPGLVVSLPPRPLAVPAFDLIRAGGHVPGVLLLGTLAAIAFLLRHAQHNVKSRARVAALAAMLALPLFWVRVHRHEPSPLPWSAPDAARVAALRAVIRNFVPVTRDTTLAVPRELLLWVQPAQLTAASSGHWQPFREVWVLVDAAAVITAADSAAVETLYLQRLVRLVEHGEYGVAYCADDMLLLKRGLSAQPPAEFYAMLDRRLARAGVADAAALAPVDVYGDYRSTGFPLRACAADGAMLMLPAGVSRLNSVERITAISIENIATGRMARLPWPDNCRYSEALFIPAEVMHDGDNVLRLTLWNGGLAGEPETVPVYYDAQPPQLAQDTQGNWQATDNYGELRVFLWQPSQPPRLLTGNFNRFAAVNGWAHLHPEAFRFFPAVDRKSRVALAIDESLLLPDDMLWLEDGAGHIAVYGRFDGKWRLLGTRHADFNPDNEGLPTTRELAAPLMSHNR